jgi:hypothetical protein
MFVEENTVLASDYNDPSFQKSIHKEVEESFPGINIILIPTKFEDDAFDSKYGSACGTHINSTVTKQHI